MTLGELQDRMTYEEVALWSAHFALEAKEQKEAQKRMNNRRR